jgi:hypothetical protein
LPGPTAAVSNAAGPVHATTSPATPPVTVQLVSVAAAVPSYTLLAAVIAGVTVAAVMSAVVVAVGADST